MFPSYVSKLCFQVYSNRLVLPWILGPATSTAQTRDQCFTNLLVTTRLKVLNIAESGLSHGHLQWRFSMSGSLRSTDHLVSDFFQYHRLSNLYRLIQIWWFEKYTWLVRNGCKIVLFYPDRWNLWPILDMAILDHRRFW